MIFQMSRKLLDLSLSAPVPCPAHSGCLSAFALPLQRRPGTATLTLTGDWQISVSVLNAEGQPFTATLDVTPPVVLSVKAEEIAALPIFNPKAGGWVKGAALAAVRAQECTTPHLLEPESLELRTGPEPDAPLLTRGTDYEADLAWATIGRLTNGVLKEGQPVFATYRHGLLRLDSVVLTSDGRIVLRPGEAKPAAPVPPTVAEGERRLANVYLPGRIRQTRCRHISSQFSRARLPEPPLEHPSPAEKFAPRTMAKLRSGEPLRILAWGDSVTVGTFVPDWEHQRWQEQFVTRLQRTLPESADRTCHRSVGRAQHRQLSRRTARQRTQLRRESAARWDNSSSLRLTNTHDYPTGERKSPISSFRNSSTTPD